MTRVRILHISDLHIRADWSADQEEIVNALQKDVQAFAASQAFDLVCFTGDLAFSGEPAQFALGERLLLEPLLAGLGLGKDRLIVVPGNHDVHRLSIDRLDHAGLESILVNRESVNALLDAEDQRSRAATRLQHFETFVASYLGDALPAAVDPFARVRRLDIRGTSLGVVALNSAWRCSDDSDRGKLLLGDRQTRRGLEAVSDCDICLVALHHPLGWLIPFDSKSAQHLFEQHGCIVLSGHEHHSNPTAEMTASGHAVYSRAGCLYETHEYSNSYTILDLDESLGSVDVHIRTWWAPERREFDKAVHLASDGRLSFSLPRRRSSSDSARSRQDKETVVVGAVVPPEIQAAVHRSHTALYKSRQLYSFEVSAIDPDKDTITVLVRNEYAIVNPTSMRLEHRPGLTPVRPIKVVSAAIGGQEVDLSNGDFMVERGLIVPVSLPPDSETTVDLRGEIQYRLPDAEVFLTYLPALSYELQLRFPAGRLRFISEALMPDQASRAARTAEGIEEIVYRAPSAVLGYWGVKLDWIAA